MIIGISGKKQTGKTTVTSMIQYITSAIEPNFQQWESHIDLPYWDDGVIDSRKQYYKNLMFADPLKKFTADVLNCTLEDLEDDRFKETPLGKEWHKHMLLDGTQATGIYAAKELYRIDKLTPRIIMQLLGTEVAGGIHNMILVHGLMGKIRPNENVVISDVRKLNEVIAIDDRKGIIFRLFRDGEHDDNHKSETELDNIKWDNDKLISNNSCLESLYDTVYYKLKIHNLI